MILWQIAVISKVYTKIHNFSMIPLKYIVNALIQMSKLHLPLIETFLWKKYVCGRKIVIKNVCDEKNAIKTFVLKNLKLWRKT